MNNGRIRIGWVVTIAVAVVALLLAAVPGAAAGADPNDECKDGGWRQLTSDGATPFRNQGDCVSFVAQGNTPLPPGHIVFGPLGRESSNGCFHRVYAVNVPPGTYTMAATQVPPGNNDEVSVTIVTANQRLPVTFLTLFGNTSTLSYSLTNGAQTYSNTLTIPCLTPAS